MPDTMLHSSLTPEQVQLAFDYVLAIDASDADTAADLMTKLTPYPGLLGAVAQEIVFPVTALSDDMDDVTADSFVLDELGVVFLMAIRGWNDACPRTALPGIARCIAHFTAQVLADVPQNVTRTLEAMRNEYLERARAVHSGAGGHR
ncbi:hypothetical protein [Streptomyces sp. WAC01526]|uniref:hypothetical protein n=1 Tax=Streptomyces sp. WAC01526 TaxID=2588709 RepID=UPI0011E04035|nr:hypothetical protein [Streptomyces sp. WAC01526]